MTDRSRGSAGWSVAGWLVIAVVLFSHVLFIAMDGRVPRDAGGHYENLPVAYHLMVRADRWTRLPQLVAGTMGGWYDVMLAYLLHTFGASTVLLRACHLAWLALLLWGVGALARAVSGAPGRVAALSICGATPAVVELGRTGWIHVPEAALLVASTVVVVVDSRLSRWRSVVLLAGLGGLAAALRPSSLPWLVPLGLALVAGRPAWGRAAAVGFAWAICATPSLRSLQAYAGRKLEARARYEAVVPDFGHELWTGWGPLLLVAVGLGLAGVLRARERSTPVLLMWSWIVVGLGLKLVLHSGLGDLTPVFVAAAILAGVGLARQHPLAPLLPVPVFLLAAGGPWLPDGPRQTVSSLLHPDDAEPFGPLGEFDRPFAGWGGDQVQALLAATCPTRRPCLVAIEQGLFYPYSDSDATLELLFVPSGPVKILNLNRHFEPLAQPGVDALAGLACGPEREAEWMERFPRVQDRLDEVTRASHLDVAWTSRISGPCVFTWWTPRGVVAHPELLPAAVAP